MHAIGGSPSRPRRPGIASKSWRASVELAGADEPGDGWRVSVRSSVVPDRGSPTMKTGRSVCDARPAESLAKKAAIE